MLLAPQLLYLIVSTKRTMTLDLGHTNVPTNGKMEHPGSSFREQNWLKWKQ